MSKYENSENIAVGDVVQVLPPGGNAHEHRPARGATGEVTSVALGHARVRFSPDAIGPDWQFPLGELTKVGATREDE